MDCQTECCVLTRGEFFISDACGGCEGGLPEILCEVQSPFKKVGNVSSCLVEIQSQVIGKQNKYNKSSSLCARTQVTGVNLTITFNCASKENLYRALHADAPAVSTGSETQEFCVTTLSECDFFPFSRKVPTQATLVVDVLDAMGSVLETLEDEVDFIYSRSGIEIIADLDIPDASVLRMVYDYNTAGFFDIDFLSKYSGYKTVYFKGSNYDAGGDGMFDAIFHKVLFAPVNQFDLITKDEFLTLTLSGSVDEADGSWFKITKQEG